MRPCNSNKPSIDPRGAARQEGAGAIARLLRGAGYVIKRKTLNDLWVALDLAMPLLAAGPAGTGKTSLVEALAEGCNLPLYEVTGHPGQEARDVIGAWNRRAQDRAEDAAIAAGLGLEEAARRRWADEYFECGEVLDAYREAARAAEAGAPPPALLIDEVEKLEASIQHTLLQPFARGFAAVPKLKGVIGVADPMLAPIVVMTTNDLNKLGEPLRDRCILTMIESPTPAEEVAVFRARVPQASRYLIGAAAKLLHKIRTGMDEITHKPGIRGAALLLRGLSRHGVDHVTRRTLEPYLGCLARDGEDEKNLYAALATLELAANRPHAVIDEAVRLEFEKNRLRLCGEEEVAA
jgi:MoxR-like ATPase